MPGAIKVLSFSEGTSVTAPSTTTTFTFQSNSLILGSDSGLSTVTDNTTKAHRLVARHYDTDATNWCGVGLVSTSTYNAVEIGGGTSTFNAATQVDVYTGATQTTVTGTRRMNISSVGAVTFDSIHNVGAGNITSGTWTPAPTQITGSYTVAPAFSTGTAKFLRVGSVVYGVFKFTAQPSATTGIELRWSLPVVSSNFSAATELSGTLQSNLGLQVPDPSIQALSSGQLMRLFWTPTVAGGSVTYTCAFCFQVP